MNKIFLMCLLTIVTLFSGCLSTINTDSSEATTSEQTAEYKKITAEEADQMMKDGETFILLDVRTEEEFAENRIEGAVLIPHYEIKECASTELTDKDARILIYCRSGRRSELAANELINMGYTNVYDFGGIIDWPYNTIIEGKSS